MRNPADCHSLSEVRQEIDRLDERIISLLGERARYVSAAARFKTSESAVAAPERQAAMLEVRRQWAQREGVSPDLVEDLYRRLVAHFIERELQEWRGNSGA